MFYTANRKMDFFIQNKTMTSKLAKENAFITWSQSSYATILAQEIQDFYQ